VPKPLDEVVACDPRFRVEAYVYIHDALNHTLKRIGTRRHVTGPELLEGIRELAIERYGLMAKTVFNSWGVRTTDDFGSIVFNLVNAGLMGKTAEDRIEDFHAVYDFDSAFVRSYSISPDQPV
jgi:uncharacterized repeat protein (TIGR04138 family)